MRIKLDDKHYLNSDQYCYWITCEFIIEKGKKAGETGERRVSGYRATLDEVVESYVNKRINSSEATTLKELASELKKLKKDLKTWKICIEAI